MDLRCKKLFTLPNPYRLFEAGKVYPVDVESYDLKAHPWLKFFDAPAPKAEAPKKSKREQADDDLTK